MFAEKQIKKIVSIKKAVFKNSNIRRNLLDTIKSSMRNNNNLNFHQLVDKDLVKMKINSATKIPHVGANENVKTQIRGNPEKVHARTETNREIVVRVKSSNNNEKSAVESEIQQKMKELLAIQLNKVSETADSEYQYNNNLHKAQLNMVLAQNTKKKPQQQQPQVVPKLPIDGVLPNGDFIGFPFFRDEYNEDRRKLHLKMLYLCNKYKVKAADVNRTQTTTNHQQKGTTVKQVKATKIPPKVLAHFKSDIIDSIKKKNVENPANKKYRVVVKQELKTEPKKSAIVVEKRQQERTVIVKQEKPNSLQSNPVIVKKQIESNSTEPHHTVNPSKPPIQISELKLKRVKIGNCVILPTKSQSINFENSLKKSLLESSSSAIPSTSSSTIPAELPQQHESYEVDQKPPIFNQKVLSNIDQDLSKIKTYKIEDEGTSNDIRTFNQNKSFEEIQSENIQMKLMLKVLQDKFKINAFSEVCKKEEKQDIKEESSVWSGDRKNSDIVIHSVEVKRTEDNPNSSQSFYSYPATTSTLNSSYQQNPINQNPQQTMVVNPFYQSQTEEEIESEFVYLDDSAAGGTNEIYSEVPQTHIQNPSNHQYSYSVVDLSKPKTNLTYQDSFNSHYSIGQQIKFLPIKNQIAMQQNQRRPTSTIVLNAVPSQILSPPIIVTPSSASHIIQNQQNKIAPTFVTQSVPQTFGNRMVYGSNAISMGMKIIS